MPGAMAEFVLGCVQLGLAYGAANATGKPSRSAALGLLAKATLAGIGCFDTARGYGDAEDRLGEALGAGSATIITKLSALSDIAESESAIATAVEASVNASREALRRNRLDCVLLHRAVHRTLWGGAVWRRLLAYREEGLIGRLGVSVQSPKEAEEAFGDRSVEHIQLPFNLIDKRWDGVLSTYAERPEVTVHVRSVFLQGLLAANNAALWPKVDGVDSAALVDQIAGLVRDLGRSSAADLCLAYARGHRQIHGVVIGLETEAQLDANLALFAGPPLSPEECLLVKASLPSLPVQLLNPALWPKR